jgi:hypothetical protein
VARNWAVSIGINQYQFASLKNLEYAKKDAQSIADFFKNEAGFDEVLLFSEDSANYKGENTNPCRTPLIRFFEKQFSSSFLSPSDSLWLFFSGHGIRYSGRDYILPADGDTEFPDSTCIALDYISQKLNCSGAGHKFLIIDSCRVDGRKGQGYGESGYEGVTTFFSCQPYESSWEIGHPVSLGSFTHVLLQLFRKYINKNNLTIEQAEKDLQRESIALNRKYEKPIQTPHISCDSATRANLPLFPPSFRQATASSTESRDKNKQKTHKKTRDNKVIGKVLSLKKDALDAEGVGQFALAKDLWGQIFMLSPSEQSSYIKAIERIAERSRSSDIWLSISESSNQSNKGKNKRVDLSSQTSNQLLDDLNNESDSLSGLGGYPFNFEFITLDENGRNVNRHKGLGKYIVESIVSTPILLVAIPGGYFTMGSQEEKAVPEELPRHKVKIKSFLIGQSPITKSQWKEVAKLPKVDLEIPLRPCLKGGHNHPVVGVSWFEACEFCNRLSKETGYKYRLPTEAEWEYACRAGTNTPFHFGYSINRHLANFDSEYTVPTNNYPFANAFGLYDMHGNVWEWCKDHWHESYEGAPNNGAVWVNSDDNKKRVLRGGSWRNESRLCRSAYRIFDDAHSSSNNVGFRIARSI